MPDVMVDINWHTVVYGEERMRPSLLADALCIIVAFEAMSADSLTAMRSIARHFNKSKRQSVLSVSGGGPKLTMGLGVDTCFPMTGAQLVKAHDLDEQARSFCGKELCAQYARVSFSRQLRDVNKQGVELDGPAERIHGSGGPSDGLAEPHTSDVCTPLYGFVSLAYRMQGTFVTLARAMSGNTRDEAKYDFQPDDIIEVVDNSRQGGHCICIESAVFSNGELPLHTIGSWE